MKLTKSAIESAEYDGRSKCILWDDEVKGFGLRVYPTGAKAYVLKYRTAGGRRGRQRLMKIAAYGTMTLKEARRRARSLLVQVADGGDPIQGRQGSADEPTLADLTQRYLEEHAQRKKARSSIRNDRNMLDLHILPKLGARTLVAQVTRSDVARMHHQMRESPYAANRVVALLRKAMSLAELWGWRQEGTNPCRGIQPYREKKRKRYLDGHEFERLAKAIEEAREDESVHPHVIGAVLLYLLTGCRMREVLNAKLSALDLDRGVLEVDGKTGRRAVLLSKPAIQVIEALPRSVGAVYMIEGRDLKKPRYDVRKGWERLRSMAGLGDVRIHDLRHTFGAAATGAGVGLQITGRLLGHTQPSTTARYAHVAPTPAREAVELVGATVAASLGLKADGEV